MGQIIGEVLRQLDDERCEDAWLLLKARDFGISLEDTPMTAAYVLAVIVKASSGPRYVVGCRGKVEKAKLTSSTRVALDMTTLTIMRALPREVGAWPSVDEEGD